MSYGSGGECYVSDGLIGIPMHMHGCGRKKRCPRRTRTACPTGETKVSGVQAFGSNVQIACVVVNIEGPEVEGKVQPGCRRTALTDSIRAWSYSGPDTAR